MSDRPIIFSAPMVRALLEGRKTMTRRLAWAHFDAGAMVIEPGDAGISFERNLPACGRVRHVGPGQWHFFCERPSPWQRVRPGDRLWVRETWQKHMDYATVEDARRLCEHIGSNFGCVHAATPPESGFPAKWRSAIHMPRWASRLTLTVTATKIERLQEITEADAKAEAPDARHGETQWRNRFMDLWCHLHSNGAIDAWNANPEVVALTFTVAPRNIDTAEAAA